MGWKRDRDKFINPYNFISIGEKCTRDTNILEDIKKKNLLNGYIECIITTKTPIFIPNTTSDKAFKINECPEHKSYDFFSYETLDNNEKYDDKYFEPVIPGSSLRGIIRSSYESVTNSCMSVIDNKRILYKRFPDPGKPGLIVRDGDKVQLYEAKRHTLKYINKHSNSVENIKISQYHEGDFVNVQAGKKHISGYLLKGEKFANKKYHVSVMERKNFITKLGEEDLDNLTKVIELYEDETINKTVGHNGYKEYKTSLEEFKKGKRQCLPLFYKKNNNEYYLSPACITKEVYKNTVEKILHNFGEFNPCKDIDKLCEACSLFGMVGEEEYNQEYSNSTSSRVRFTDAKIYDKDNIEEYFSNIITLKELSSPKISATEFYLKKPKNVDMCTYDFAFNWGKNNRKCISNYKPEIRGRKIYLHNKKEEPSSVEITKRNVTIRPVKENMKFKFRIYFEGIKEEQLKRLIWVLNIGSNDVNKDGYHKLGMAKSLGLGSIKISVKNVKVRKINFDDFKITYEYVDFSDNNNYEYNEKQLFKDYPDKPLNEFIKATKLNISSEIPITYPLGEDTTTISINSKASHQWFIGNRSIKGTGIYPVIDSTLPNISDKDISLPKYKKVKK